MVPIVVRLSKSSGMLTVIIMGLAVFYLLMDPSPDPMIEKISQKSALKREAQAEAEKALAIKDSSFSQTKATYVSQMSLEKPERPNFAFLGNSMKNKNDDDSENSAENVTALDSAKKARRRKNRKKRLKKREERAEDEENESSSNFFFPAPDEKPSAPASTDESESSSFSGGPSAVLSPDFTNHGSTSGLAGLVNQIDDTDVQLSSSSTSASNSGAGLSSNMPNTDFLVASQGIAPAGAAPLVPLNDHQAVPIDRMAPSMDSPPAPAAMPMQQPADGNVPGTMNPDGSIQQPWSGIHGQGMMPSSPVADADSFAATQQYPSIQQPDQGMVPNYPMTGANQVVLNPQYPAIPQMQQGQTMPVNYPATVGADSSGAAQQYPAMPQIPQDQGMVPNYPMTGANQVVPDPQYPAIPQMQQGQTMPVNYPATVGADSSGAAQQDPAAPQIPQDQGMVPNYPMAGVNQVVPDPQNPTAPQMQQGQTMSVNYPTVVGADSSTATLPGPLPQQPIGDSSSEQQTGMDASGVVQQPQRMPNSNIIDQQQDQQVPPSAASSPENAPGLPSSNTIVAPGNPANQSLPAFQGVENQAPALTQVSSAPHKSIQDDISRLADIPSPRCMEKYLPFNRVGAKKAFDGDYNTSEASFIGAIVIPHYKLVLCTIPKAGCSNLRALAVRLRAQSPDAGAEYANYQTPASWRSNNQYRPLHGQLKYMPLSEIERIANDPEWLKVAVVRNPFTRLISAYYDKFVTGKEKVGKLKPDDGVEKFVTEFSMKPVTALNEHFKDQSRMCGFDYINYNHVIHLEDIRQGLRCLAQTRGFLDKVDSGWDLGVRNEHDIFSMKFGHENKNYRRRMDYKDWWDDKIFNIVYARFFHDYRQLNYPKELPNRSLS